VSPSDSDALKTYVKDFIDTHGIRPTALEVYRDGYSPRSVRKNYGSWFGFLQSIDALDSNDMQAAGACSTFLESLEATPMTRSFKMVTLLGMLNADRFPGAIDISDLVSRYSGSVTAKARSQQILERTSVTKHYCVHLWKPIQ
jgi:hypothetical protein